MLLELIVTAIESMNQRELDRFVVSLTDHATPAIRLATLNNIVLMATSADSLSNSTKARLKECVPYFHQETSAKHRNEFITLISALCSKLRRVSSGSVSSGPHRTGLSSPDGQPMNKHRARDAHFLTWYMGYLVDELRPTSTYQGHITALSILRNLARQHPDLTGLQVLFATSCPPSTSPENIYRKLRRLLLDLVFDPFNDVQDVASSLVEVLVRYVSPFSKSIPESLILWP